jgi:hypothetical protein
MERRILNVNLIVMQFSAAFYFNILRPTHPPSQWVHGALSRRVKRPGREANHLPPSSAEVKEWVELYLHSPNTATWRGAQLKHRNNFTLPSYFNIMNLFDNVLFHITTTCSFHVISDTHAKFIVFC